MRPGRKADRRPLWAFLLVLIAGLGILAWSASRSEPEPRAQVASPIAEQPAVAAASTVAKPSESAQAVRVQVASGPIVPTRLTIPAIDVDAPVESRGTVRYENPFTGDMVDGYGVPEAMHSASWWSDGPRPGSAEMAVILGHQQAAGGAVFDRLTAVDAGDEVTLLDSSGAVLRLTVLGSPLTGLDKSTSALADALNDHPAGAAVALVTCGGEFDDDAGASQDNTVVFAALAR